VKPQCNILVIHYKNSKKIHTFAFRKFTTMKHPFICFLLIFLLAVSCQQNDKLAVPPAPYGPVPTEAQLKWQQMEMNMFCHFGPNTFTGNEWGEGTEAEDIFNPTALDCGQWATIAKAAGFKGIILTAKHHDGFCLWPNPESEHTVAHSSWRNGKGDVLKELSDACRQEELGFGIYISPWDRNAPTYGTPEYNGVFKRTLESALSQYGEVFEQWFDGACGEGPNGKRQEYDWPLFNNTVHQLQTQALIFSDVGPGCRWVGNEEGRAGRTCWSLLNTDGFTPGAGAPPQDTLTVGNRNGKHWIPAEVDVSIRPGWFYRDSEHPKSVKELMHIYYQSVGRNGLLLLNVPPDQRGLIAREDSLRLMQFAAALKSVFSEDLTRKAYTMAASNIRGVKYPSHYWMERGFVHGVRNINEYEYGVFNLLDGRYDTYWTVDDSVTSASVVMSFPEQVTFNRVMLQEYIPLGQRVSKFHIKILTPDGEWKTIATETTIGYKRILLVPMCTAKAVRICIDESLACPVLNRVALFKDEVYSNLAEE
jgi:alpha-L-fucosidase